MNIQRAIYEVKVFLERRNFSFTKYELTVLLEIFFHRDNVWPKIANRENANVCFPMSKYT